MKARPKTRPLVRTIWAMRRWAWKVDIVRYGKFFRVGSVSIGSMKRVLFDLP